MKEKERERESDEKREKQRNGSGNGTKKKTQRENNSTVSPGNVASCRKTKEKLKKKKTKQSNFTKIFGFAVPTMGRDGQEKKNYGKSISTGVPAIPPSLAGFHRLHECVWVCVCVSEVLLIAPKK